MCNKEENTSLYISSNIGLTQIDLKTICRTLTDAIHQNSSRIYPSSLTIFVDEQMSVDTCIKFFLQQLFFFALSKKYNYDFCCWTID